MVKQRIVTAVGLAVPFLAALFYAPHWLWAWLMLAVTLIGLHEWGRLMGMQPAQQQNYVLLSGLMGGGIMWMRLHGDEAADDMLACGLFVLAAVFWTLVVPVWLHRGWQRPRPRLAAVAGWLVLFPAWIALLDLRAENPGILLALLAVIWLSDSGAFFCGRKFGRHKLAPGISPGKTWEGVAGAAALVSVYSLVLCQALGISLWLIPLNLMLSVYGIMGDLYESWIKRCAGVKDSGELLPGHGGVLDRIDALLPVLPLAALYLIIDSHLFY